MRREVAPANPLLLAAALDDQSDTLEAPQVIWVGEARAISSQRVSLARGIDGYDIRTIQELPGHKHVETTMIYTHVLNRGGTGVKRPAN